MQITKRLETFLQGTKKLYIDGKFVPSASGSTFVTPNPATGETLMTLYEAQTEDIDSAVKAARKAFDHGEWRTMPAASRSRLMYKLADLMEEHKTELAQLKHLITENRLMKRRMGISRLQLSICVIMPDGLQR